MQLEKLFQEHPVVEGRASITRRVVGATIFTGHKSVNRKPCAIKYFHTINL